MAKVVVNPESDLSPRSGDEELTPDELARIDLFANLKKAPSFDRFPGSIVMRRYKRGDIICRQGDAGATAFYILRSEDVLALMLTRLKAVRGTIPGTTDHRLRKAHERLIDTLETDVQQLRERAAEPAEERPGGGEARRAATAHLLVDLAPRQRRGGLLARIGDMFSGGRRNLPDDHPDWIPNDGPTDINYETRQAPMYEGDIFGEMSCMTLAPRSATIVADAPCFMLEFLRNIFDQIQRDDGYRQRVDADYRERVLKNHLRRLDLLRSLSDEQLNRIRDRAELVVVEPGQVIFDQHDPSDSVFLVRSGLVQVFGDLNLALAPDDVTDWQAFCRDLIAADSDGDSPRAAQS
jgi:CRP-like cAMP-binding protein